MKGRLLLFSLLLLVMLLAAVITGYTLVWRLVLLTAILFVVSYWWAALGIASVAIAVNPLPSRIQAGEVVFVEGVVTNNSHLPKPWLRIKSGAGELVDAVLQLRGKSEVTFRSRAVFPRRGRYNLGSFEVVASDPLGLFQRRRMMTNPQPVLVCPATWELPFFELLTHYDYVAGGGPWLREQISPNVSGVREYYPGDSPRRIHWPSTVHADKLMVKMLDPDRFRGAISSVWLALDMGAAVTPGGSQEAAVECGVTITASLLKKYITSGWAAGLIADADRRYIFPPQHGEPHLWRMLEAMATIEPPGEVTIEQLLASETARFELGALVIVVTPLINERLGVNLQRIKNHVGGVMVVLVSPTEAGMPARLALAASLRASGISGHVVRCGEDIGTALDNRIRVIHEDVLLTPSSEEAGVR